jgi:hypothetical protein
MGGTAAWFYCQYSIRARSDLIVVTQRYLQIYLQIGCWVHVD